jgi:hypothetical protein
MQSLFDPVIAEITNLVSQQVEEAKEKKDAVIDVLPYQTICTELREQC